MLTLYTLFASLALMQQNPPNAFKARAHDWRMGAVVYQIFVDRFSPSTNLEAKRKLFLPPRALKSWDELPNAAPYDPKIGYAHTLEFWGGDLQSVRRNLGYVAGLGADILYLTPIFKAFSNHKYDTEDYAEIAPEFGTKQDLKDLLQATHKRKMKLVLDGVFNHVGREFRPFQEAKKDPKSPYRKWFSFDKQYRDGYKGWYGLRELPALKLENRAVQDYLWRGQDSIVRHYLKQGVDGWRLDVAFDMGPKLLAQITQAAHEAKPGSLVVGEISGYPSEWFDSVDGVFNFHTMQVMEDMLHGQISGGRAGRMQERAVSDAGIENLLRSWLHIDNHDTPRAANKIPAPDLRRLAYGLLFTLPGSPVLYYGSEVGLEGAGDPENRAPMPWERVRENVPKLQWVRRLGQLRKNRPALRYGDYRSLDTDKLFAFTRTTDSLRDLTLVIVNPTEETVEETFNVRSGRLLSWGLMEEVFTGEKTPARAGLFRTSMPPRSLKIFIPVIAPNAGYSPYERIP